MKSYSPVADEQNSEINLTPMLDVVFIVLIFFVVTASFFREIGINVAATPTSYSMPPTVESITVTVEPASTFIVNDRVVSRGGLIPYVHALYAQNPHAGFGVVVAPGSMVKDAVAAADAGRSLGFDVIPISAMEQD